MFKYLFDFFTVSGKEPFFCKEAYYYAPLR